jgi:DNA replication protein DnaC
MKRIETSIESPIANAATSSSETCGCDGGGMIFMVDGTGHRSVRDCSCRIQKRIDARLAKTKIPGRYRGESLDTFEAMGEHPSKGRALAVARRFVAEYPTGTEGRGVLLLGPVGVGKTHLAIGILRSLVLDKGAAGLFCDFRELMNEMNSTYGRKGRNEDEVLEPVFAADILVLDELGGARKTDWSFETVESILNGRYNDRKSTIITTNLPNEGPKGGRDDDAGDDYGAASLRLVMTGETLGDRIGARMHSRLQQMCQVVTMGGDDYRLKKGKL